MSMATEHEFTIPMKGIIYEYDKMERNPLSEQNRDDLATLMFFMVLKTLHRITVLEISTLIYYTRELIPHMRLICLSQSYFVSAIFSCLLFASFPTVSATIPLNQYDKLATVEGITANKEVEAQLKSLLGSEYNDFILNFDLYGEPHYTADGGLFVNGMMQHLAQENASALVIYPDGSLSAAWILPGESIIHYRTSRPSEGINSDIQQWASQLEGRKLQNQTELFSGKWHGEENSASTFSLQLSQQNNKLSGSWCFITQGGNRIDCPDEQQQNLAGEVKDNVATITFNSTFGGVNGKATLTISGETLQWRMIQPPVNGDYYAPERYTLIKERANAGAATRLLSTSKFTIAIRNNCGEFTMPCDDVLYTGVRNSDNSTISLQGKTVLNSNKRVVGAEFINGKVIYLVTYNPPQLIVQQGEKVLVSQPGQWLK